MNTIPDIPQTISEISSSWLTAQLRRNSGLSDVTVRSFQHNQIGADQGYNGDIFQLHLDFDNVAQGPRSLVLKMPASTGGLFEPDMMNLLNSRETAFYNELQGKVGLRVPKIYVAVSDTDTNRHLILMEDLSDLITESYQEFVSPDKAMVGVQALAGMHARWWEDSRLRNFEWIDNYAKSSQISRERFSKMWSVTRSRYSGEFGEYAVTFGNMFEEKIDRVLQHLGSAPVTLNHGDPRPANMVIDSTVEPPEPVLFDWQRPSYRRGAVDLAHYIGRGVMHSNDASIVTELVDYYYANLLNEGVRDYDADQLLFDFRLGLHIPFVIMVSQAWRADPEVGIASTAILRTKGLIECVDALATLKDL